MIQVTPHIRILLATEPADFRKGIDGLAALCRQKLQEEPMDGAMFVFHNRTGKALKLLVYDGQGYWLCQKRLSRGSFKWWPSSREEKVSALAAHQLQSLLWNGDPYQKRTGEMWQPIAPAA